ncbi:RagB/SusD family nutrient uptake outer membrane protein [Flavivirga rizhaonensis]|uniref:RagB/SusD family nutrient uptake outer membrane protein n=1 Tax=Flavivirga rizhaonensis TaxID=2559571 RepID=A0A4S1E132_9FLAO|nr:RagB/SusD family nutrient uptake outer membrane protein [Flavivirga rizhaonensis]TGV04209.1 RagB/SusD family nutrient uptake outer membrane protein [Flavivirga rizhaonensis]
MKSLKKLILIGLVLVTAGSCNEQDFLKEEAFGFYSPENSYTSPTQIESAIAKMHENVRNMLFENNDRSFIFQYTADYAYDAINPTHALNSWADRVFPEAGEVDWMWRSFYKIIFNANVILGRIGAIEYSSEEERAAHIAEAKFFRAWSYRGLGIIFGGVPLTLEEATSPVRDYVRASRQDVWNLIIQDLTEAVPDLPGADDVADGRVTKGAANHLLTEMYIIVQDYDKAISAATEVIENSGYALMQNRFGSRSGEPGDVYWDLFRRDNQNRGSGNTESIWVSQYEYLTPGGGRGDNLPRFLMPLYWQLKDDNGENLFTGPNENFGGRGIGWWAPTDYWLIDVWQNSNADMRNSEFNIIRDIVANNPASAFFGQPIIASGAIDDDFPDPYNRWWNVIIAKGAPLGNFPEEVIQDPATGLTTNFANSSYRDRYMMRLPETYLLRAEAYLLKGDAASAAGDINIVRARVNADPVSPGDVDMDYILDERARELFAEELRLLTLMRMDKIVERVRKYDPMHNGKYASNGINDHQNLWPIPNQEIERNTEAVLEQNPGYN